MNRSTHAHRRVVGLAAVTLGVGLAAALSSAPPAGAAAPATPVTAPSRHAPQLSIAVDDNRRSALTGDRIAYTITVRNLGSTKITGLTATQSVPTGLSFGSADSGGVLKDGTLRWALNLKAGGAATMHTRMTVTATPADLLRLAVVACTSLSVAGRPIVCAADSDQLPAGAAKDRPTAQPARPDHSSSAVTWWSVGGGAVLLALLTLVVVVIRRRPASRDAE